ncbi:unnamed protein product [Allacma fusca]|uniref:Protein quiver n=1 Tax=Allacma fusca TaxID=39272 RepID=A0A8J2L1J0_9HEXA|nr:unnamed protein product [Allacma fusca]
MLLTIITLLYAAALSSVDASVWCYQCVSSQPGCGTPFDWRWFATVSCDKCVKIIERKGSDEVITRDCLSKVQYSRHDVPADKYEGCRSASKDIRLAHYVNNSIKELDVRRDYYDEVTWCFCEFDHWCNSGSSSWPSLVVLSSTLILLGYMS